MTRYPFSNIPQGQFTNIIKVTRHGAKQYMEKEVAPFFLKMQKKVHT